MLIPGHVLLSIPEQARLEIRYSYKSVIARLGRPPTKGDLSRFVTDVLDTIVGVDDSHVYFTPEFELPNGTTRMAIRFKVTPTIWCELLMPERNGREWVHEAALYAVGDEAPSASEILSLLLNFTVFLGSME